MSYVATRDLTLADVTAFNEQLLILERAGLQFDPGCGDRSAPLATRLNEISAKLAIRVGHGQSLADALSAPNQVSPEYRLALETWCHTDDATEALQVLQELAEQRHEIEAVVSYSLLQPLIIFTLVYAAFILLSMLTAPRLEAIHAQLDQPPSTSLRMLITARQWLPLWGPVVPLVVAAAIFWWRSRASNFEFKWLPGRNQLHSSLFNANYAENVAKLLESDKSLAQALTLVGPLPPPAHTSSKPPRLLHWALNGELIRPAKLSGSVATADRSLSHDRAAVLRFAAHVYRAAAERQSHNRRHWLPLVVGTGVSGLLVLAYGLSLFAPVVALLEKLTQK